MYYQINGVNLVQKSQKRQPEYIFRLFLYRHAGWASCFPASQLSMSESYQKNVCLLTATRGGEVGSRRIAFKQGSLFYPDSVGHLLRGSLNAFQAA